MEPDRDAVDEFLDLLLDVAEPAYEDLGILDLWPTNEPEDVAAREVILATVPRATRGRNP